MLVWLIPLIIVVVSLVVLVVIILPKASKLKLIKTETLPETHSADVKEAIILQRIDRLRQDKLKGVNNVIGSAWRNFKNLIKKIYRQVQNLEDQYKKMQAKELREQGKVVEPEVIEKLLAEAKELIKEEKFLLAEKKYLEILSHDPKNTKVYEMLGNLYIRMKQPHEARQTFDYILKINPSDASVLTSLGEIAMQEKKYPEAIEYFEQATAKRPYNPKYLDFYIESCIMGQEISKAKQGTERLKEVNPENQKIIEFEKRIKAVEKKQKKTTKTDNPKQKDLFEK